MSNPNIFKEAKKGGKARWKGVSKAKRRQVAMKAGIMSGIARAQKKAQRLVDSQAKLA